MEDLNLVLHKLTFVLRHGKVGVLPVVGIPLNTTFQFIS